jgi:serine/threonine-protein kinase HipA
MAIVPDSLMVRLNDYPVGVLSRLPGNLVTFYFTQQFIDDPDRPTLSLGWFDAYRRLRTKLYSSSLGIVPPFFANLLPEGDLRRYVAHRAGVSTEDDFALLWLTGGDLPGAVTVVDPQGRPLPPPAAGLPASGIPPSQMLRFSLAGVQLKFSAVENAYGGLTIPAQGIGGDWIVKLPSRHLALVPENEYAMMCFAQDVGIEIPEIRLAELSTIEGLPAETAAFEGSALLVRRFDRGVDGARVHIEDFNQIYRQAPKMKYDNRAFADIAGTIYQALGNEALIDFIHRLVFNVGIGNNDMHLKNWSLIYRDGRTPALAPVYDFVCTTVYLGHTQTGLALGSARYFPEVTFEQFGRLAERARVSRGLVERAAREMVERMRNAWPATRAMLPFEKLRTALEHQLARVPIFASGEVRVTPGGTEREAAPEEVS